MNEKPKKVTLTVLDGRTEFVEQDLESALAAIRRLFESHGVKLIYAVLAFSIVFYGYNTYQNTQQEKRKQGAAILERTQSSLASYEEALANKESKQEDKDALEKRITAEITSLKDAASPYNEYVLPYQIRFDVLKNDLPRVSGELKEASEKLNTKIAAAKDESSALVNDPAVLILQRAELLAARALLVSPEFKESGRGALLSIIKRGGLTAVEAGKSLVLFVSGDQEITEVRAALDELVNKQPAFRKNLEEELEKLS